MEIHLTDPSELDNVSGGTTIIFNCIKCGEEVKRIYWPYRKEQCSVFMCKSCKTASNKFIEGVTYAKDNPVELTNPTGLDSLKSGSWFTFKCEVCGKQETHQYFPYRRNLYSKFLCKQHKTESTNIETYGRKYNIGTPETVRKSLETQRKNNDGLLWQQTEEGKDYLSKYNKEHPEIHLKSNKSYEDRTGYETPFHNPEVRKIAVDAIVETYGTKNVMSIPEIQSKASDSNRKHHGGILYKQTEKGRKETSDMTNKNQFRNSKFKYKDIYFDSSWELKYYMFCIDHDIPIKRATEYFNFIYNGEPWHKYTPDFIINNNEYVEIKGDHFWDNDKNEDPNYILARINCAIKNGVKILYKIDLQPVINWFDRKYGKAFLEKYKIDKK